MTIEKKCEFCDKRGLPLLLVRHAIAPHGMGAPLANPLPIELASGVAHYTKRVLRSGYVYVHDEARKRWEAYFVTEDGYLSKFVHAKNAIPVVPKKSFNCNEQGHREVARCITISDPKRATKVWIGFSDVLWTDKVLQANEDAAYRKRHMTEVNVQALLGGGTSPYAHPMSQLTAIVAEYAMDEGRGKAAFGWNGFTFVSQRVHAKNLVEKCEAIYPGKARIVAIMDPAGIAQELAVLMKHNAEKFMARPEYARNLAVNAAIEEIEAGVKMQAENDEIEAAEKNANRQISMNPLGHLLFKSTQEQTEAMRNVTSAQATRAADQVWAKYEKKLEPGARENWMKSFKAALAEYDKQAILPLAKNHAAWMKSSYLAHYFQCNYDSADINSGATYTFVMTSCIASTQDKGACSKVYDEWLAGTMEDESNLLLRAMIFNQQTIANAVKAATQVSFDLRQIPWDNILTTSDKSFSVASENLQYVGSRFIVECAGPIARGFGKILDGSPGFRNAVMGMGIIAGHPVVMCKVTGGRKEFRAHVIRQLLRTSGRAVNENQMRRAVAAELRRLQVHGVRMDGSTIKTWVLLADKHTLTGVPSGLTDQEEARWLTSSLRTAKQIEDLDLARWRSVINSSMGVGVIAGILQVICLTKVIGDEEKALLNERTDAKLRMYAAITTLAATTSEIIGNALKARAAQGLRIGQGVATRLGGSLAKVAVGAGLITGLFVAGLDIYKASKENQEGADGLLVASYLASAVVSAGLSLILLKVSILGALALPVIGLLVLLLVAIGIFIEFIKDNPVQDWMERCVWGILKDQRYSNMETEQAQLKQAVA